MPYIFIFPLPPPNGFFANLGKILAAVDKGSVITNDHVVGILVKLSAHKTYRPDTLPLLFDLMRTCPTNQFPMYCEQAQPVVPTEYQKQFAELLQHRLDEMEKESKRKRVEKVLKNFLGPF